MDPIAEAKRDEALSFLVNHDAGVLATMARSGEPHARTVYYTCYDSFNLYFITLKKTRKVADIAADPRTAFVVSEIEAPRTLQVEGKIQDLSATATVDAVLADFVRRLMERKPYGIPLSHFDGDELVFYRLTPDWIRWGDFTFGEGTDRVLTVVHPAEG